MLKENFKRRLLAGILAGAVTVTTLFASSASILAAPENKSSNAGDVSETTTESVSVDLLNADSGDMSVYQDNRAVAEALFEEYLDALEKGDTVRMQEILLKLLKLTPTQRVHLFLLKYSDYYRQHFLEGDFSYFNIYEYMATYPEVVAKYSNLSGDLLYQAVLNDYLENGIFEGKSSCSIFDPVVAILAHPDETMSALINRDGVAGLDAVRKVYAGFEGSESTSIYKVSSDLLGSRFSGLKGKAATSYNNIYLFKSIPASSGPSYGKSSDDNSSSGGTSGSDSGQRPSGGDAPAPAPTPVPTPAPVPRIDLPKAINSKTQEIDAYNGYKLGEGTQAINSKVVDPATGAYKTLTGSFFNYTYDSVRSDSTKKYTVMIYLSGAEYEWFNDVDISSASSSNDIIDMLRAEYNLDEVNVLLCVGGTKNFASGWLDENSKNIGCSIYYLNPPQGLTEKQKINKLQNIAQGEEHNGIEHATDTAIDNNTLCLLGKYDPIDTGDASLLAGFMNLAYDLFPADNFGLILNGHGAGVLGGAPSSTSYPGSIDGSQLTVYELEEALRASNLINSNRTLSFIGMDACNMGGLEVAYNVSPYADYFIGSEEIEYGSWNYAQLITAIQKAVNEAKSTDSSIDNASLARNIAKSYFTNDISYKYENYSDSAKEAHRFGSNLIQGIAAYDLTTDAKGNGNIVSTITKFNKISEEINELLTASDMSSEVNEKIQRDIYYAIRSARARCYEIGEGTSPDNDHDNGYVDLYDFLENLSKKLPSIADSYAGKYDYLQAKNIITQCSNDISDLISQKGLLYEGFYYRNGLVSLNDGSVNYVSAATSKPSGADLSTLWNELEGNKLCGLSVYMPFVHMISNEKDTNDYWINSAETTASNVSAYKDQDIIEKYTELIKSYYNYSNSQANRDRIARLKNELSKDYVLKAADEENGTPAVVEKTYKGIFGEAKVKASTQSYTMTGKDGPKTETNTVKYINVPINKKYMLDLDGKSENIDMSEDSIDPFTDLLEVISGINVYVLKERDVLDGDGKPTGEKINIVIGQAQVPSNDVSGGTESINILFSDMAAGGYKIEGKDSENNSVDQFSIVTNIINQEDVLKEKFNISDASRWIVFTGEAKVTGDDTKVNSYHVFQYNEGDFKYTYAGTLKEDHDNIEDASEVTGYSMVEDVKSITFASYTPYDGEGLEVLKEDYTFSEEFLVGPEITIEYVDVLGEATGYEIAIGLALGDTSDPTDTYVAVVSDTTGKKDDSDEIPGYMIKQTDAGSSYGDDMNVSNDEPVSDSGSDDGQPSDNPAGPEDSSLPLPTAGTPDDMPETEPVIPEIPTDPMLPEGTPDGSIPETPVAPEAPAQESPEGAPVQSSEGNSDSGDNSAPESSSDNGSGDSGADDSVL